MNIYYIYINFAEGLWVVSSNKKVLQIWLRMPEKPTFYLPSFKDSCIAVMCVKGGRPFKHGPLEARCLLLCALCAAQFFNSPASLLSEDV